MNASTNDPVIRISRDEAMDSHVDDLLKRQMSMRGDPGVTRDQGRKWYYQNWFVFTLVGLLGAVAAWGLIEPVFDDMIYYQGTVAALDPADGLSSRSVTEFSNGGLRAAARGSFAIRGQKIYLASQAMEIMADGEVQKFDPDDLSNGQQIGVYLEYMGTRRENLAVAFYVIRNPAPQPESRAKLTLDKLSGRSSGAAMLLFPLVAGFVGLFIGAADGLVCRLPRRALLCGGVGLLVGVVGGFVSSLLANVIYAPITLLAMKNTDAVHGSLTTIGFVLQMVGRSMAWCVAGVAMGLGQGIALRSRRLLVYGLVGGLIGGLLGGLVFDPIYFFLVGEGQPSAWVSRLAGLAVIGACVGAMIGVVELLARDAWLRMLQGPLTGKEFLLFKDVMDVGSSPRSDIYLFNDPLVAEHHAILRAVGDECEIEARSSTWPVMVNRRAIQRARLRHGDNVTIGKTIFVFQRRKG